MSCFVAHGTFYLSSVRLYSLSHIVQLTLEHIHSVLVSHQKWLHLNHSRRYE